MFGMDDALVERWRGGDANATTAVRNSVRSVAERVLGHSALISEAGPKWKARLRDEDQRRELTVTIAKEVMSRKAESAAALTASALMAACRQAVEALREGRTVSAEITHLPPPVLVTGALAPDSIAPRMREALDKHVSVCPACAADMRVLERIVHTQEAFEPIEPSSVSADVHGIDSEGIDLEALMRDAIQEGEAPASEGAAPRPGRRPGGAAGSARPSRPAAAPAPRRSGWMIMAPAILLFGAFAVWMWKSRTPEGPLILADAGQLSALADRRVPEISRLAELPPEAQFALGDLSAGDCRSAAGRFQDARKKQPAALDLYWLEAAAFVCAGDARYAKKAFEALDAAVLAGGKMPGEAWWVRAQVSLLAGDGPGAIDALGKTELFDPQHRDAAAEQKRRVLSAVGS
jgi:hypothetical protein